MPPYGPSGYLPPPGAGDPYPALPPDIKRPPPSGAAPQFAPREPVSPGQDPWDAMSEYQKMQSDYGRYAQESGIWGTQRDVAGPQLSQQAGQGLTPYNQATMPAYRQGGYYGGVGGVPALGGGGVGGVSGVGGPGGGGSALLEYQRGLQAEPYLPGIIGLAGREQTAIQAGAEGVPLGPGGYSIGLMEQGLRRQIEAPGMSPAEYTQAKRRITQGFGAQTGALAAAGAKGGYFSPSSVAQAGGGAPAQQLGQGLAELEAKNAEIQRREREAGIRTLASQYGTLSGQALGGRAAYQAQVGQYRKQTPIQYQGIQTTRPSSTYPGPITGGGGGGGFYAG